MARKRTSSGRALKQRVRSGGGRSTGSVRWLARQLNDPYVRRARDEGYRSRAAYKLIELDDRFQFLGPGKRVVDLGAAPGGWTQVALARCRAGGTRGSQVVALDLAAMDAVPGAILLRHDFLAEDAPARLRAVLDGAPDLVLSDMAAPATGHKRTDQLKVMALCEAALDFALESLAPGGGFVAKVLKGGAEQALVQRMRRDFAQVRHAKPPASRKDSAESYVVATGFRGRPEP
ncbi:MAG: RlmE family RNA methyltransferase [Alphaproteobacteria bacterium]|jgi:23S rRNA (uridine2552-2'-O)-methyltransferase|nr:RlmE family RNA methyltransferase [Alphaproteobacteria bacterium]MDP6517562.1 RlmE family RNA methyltransferase [Alphaproteobacteria bacterium]